MQAAFIGSAWLEQALATQLVSEKVNARLVKAYALVLAANNTRSNSIQALEAKLDGLQSSDIIQPANVPEFPVRPNKSRMAVITALATFFSLLMFVFLRQAMRKASAQPGSARKLASIRQLFFLR